MTLKIWGIHKRYPSLNWWENFMGGHLNIGKKITIFGSNAMCWRICIQTKRYGNINITFPCIAPLRKREGHKFYFSPNGTPWASTFYRGKDKDEIIRAQIRKLNFGHGFDSNKNYEKLRVLNEKFEWFAITKYDINKFPKSKE